MLHIFRATVETTAPSWAYDLDFRIRQVGIRVARKLQYGVREGT